MAPRAALCIFPDGQFHDFSGGAREHGYNALQLIEHLYPNEDATAWARDWLASASRIGSFIPSEGEPVDDLAEVEVMAFIAHLYDEAGSIDDTPATSTSTKTRGTPLCPEDKAQLRWIANYRGDEGLLLAPSTDDQGKLVKLLGIHVAPDGRKSPHRPARINNPRRQEARSLPPWVVWAERGRDGRDGEGTAARAAGAGYVIVTGGASNLGQAALPTLVRRVTIARDADPAGSESDKALWRSATLRASQQLQVVVTARPNDIAPEDAPFLKDLDDVYRYDPELVPRLINGANLDHGRLGDAVCDAVLELLSRLEAVPQGYAKKTVASFLDMELGTLNDDLERRVRARIEARKQKVIDEPDGLPGTAVKYDPVEPHPDPVDGAEMLTEMSGALRHYVRLTKSQADAVALGMVHGHVFDCFDTMPIYAVTSPQMRSGKSRLMQLVARTAPRPLLISGGNAAYLSRVIDRHHPNVFADEFDTVTKGDPEKAEVLRGMINASFDREVATVGKCVPTESGHEPRNFSVWAPFWLAGIKKVPPTIEDRSVHIQLKRKLPKDKVKRLRLKDGPEFETFRRGSHLS